jgi:amino acid transporter
MLIGRAQRFTHLRVRAGARAHGIDPSTFPFKAFGPLWISYAASGAMIFLLLIQGFTAFLDPFNYKTFITTYITIPTCKWES